MSKSKNTAKKLSQPCNESCVKFYDCLCPECESIRWAEYAERKESEIHNEKQES